MPDWVPVRRREIGDRLRNLREDRSLTQAQLGESVGRDHKTIHRWEAAKTVPSLTDLLLLARALDTTIGALCDEEE